MDHHYTGCGTCKHCRSGWAQMCLDGATVFGANGNGAHAKYMKVPVRDAGAAARRALVRDRRRHLLRHRHRLSGAQAAQPAGRRDDRDLRAGAGRPLGDAARRRDGRARDRARRLARALRARARVRRARGDRGALQQSGRGDPRVDPRRGRAQDARHVRVRRKRAPPRCARREPGAPPAMSASAGR